LLSQVLSAKNDTDFSKIFIKIFRSDPRQNLIPSRAPEGRQRFDIGGDFLCSRRSIKVLLRANLGWKAGKTDREAGRL